MPIVKNYHLIINFLLGTFGG